MLLKLGVAYGGPTESRGIGIVAGCGRSGNLANSYSHTALDHLRAWFKKVLHGDNGIEEDEERPTPVGPPTQLGTAHVVRPVAPNCGLKTQTFVDDTTMIMWAKTKIEGDNTDLPHIAYTVAEKWIGIVAKDLKLQTSDKNRCLSPGPAANAAIAGCQVNHCTAKIVKHERDLGVDTVATGKRDDTILRQRVANATERADTNVFVVNTMASSGAGVKYVEKTRCWPARVCTRRRHMGTQP